MALFGKRNTSDIPPAPIEYKPDPQPAVPDTTEPLPELDFLKPQSDSQPTPAPEAAAYDPAPVEAVITKQPQYSQLILETEKPPVITVSRYGSNYVATDHVRNLQAVEHTEYEALESLIKQYKG